MPHGQPGGKRKTQKVKTRKFYKIREGNLKERGNNNFLEIGGNALKPRI